MPTTYARDRVSVCKSAIYAGVAWLTAAAGGGAAIMYAVHAEDHRLGAMGAAILIWTLIATGFACVLSVHYLLGKHANQMLEEVSLQVRLAPRDRADDQAARPVPPQTTPLRPVRPDPIVSL